MIVTARSRALILISGIATLLGIMTRREPMALCGFAVCCWMAYEWFRFRVAANLPLSDPVRKIEGASGTLVSVSMNQAYPVQVEATIPWRARTLRFMVQDAVPVHCQPDAMNLTAIQDGNESKLAISYEITPTVAGRTHFPGLEVVVTDAHGLFRKTRFIKLPQDVNVLPFITRPTPTASVLKPNNMQIIAGSHRFRRSGLSSELLGIREYQRGDPPRSIAWKATARLGKLMTCEYESEVPIRTTIIVDLSRYQFVGRPATSPADHVVSATASLAKLLLADKDPVKIILVNGADRLVVQHGQGERHLSRLLQTMLAFCVRQNDAASLPLAELLQRVWISCFRRFPELFDEKINRARHRLMVFSAQKQLLIGQQEQLANVLAALYNKSAGTAARIRADRRLLRKYCLRYMKDFPSRVTSTVIAFDSAEQIEAENDANSTIRRSLIESVAKAHDNELFIVISVAPRDGLSTNRLGDAVKVTTAAHHRLVFIEVGGEESISSISDPIARRILSKHRGASKRERQEALRTEITRWGARWARLSDPELIQQVAAEVELLQQGRGRRGGVAGRGRF